jgi:uncharacterized membrane protein
VVGTAAGWQYAPAAGWIATAAVYLIWAWASIARMSAVAIEVVVQQQHPARGPADTIIVIASIASIASLSGVAYLLIAGTAKGPDATIAAVVGFLSVIASWLVVHAVYTLRYAILYYTEPVGGIDFNQDDNPTFADFAYLAFTIAVTYGVTDTVLRNRPIRVSVLQHAMVSYLFGTVILAVTVQVIGSLGVPGQDVGPIDPPDENFALTEHLVGFDKQRSSATAPLAARDLRAGTTGGAAVLR